MDIGTKGGNEKAREGKGGEGRARWRHWRFRSRLASLLFFLPLGVLVLFEGTWSSGGFF